MCFLLLNNSNFKLTFNFLKKHFKQRFVNFFLEKYKRHVCSADRLEFINGWYVLVIISDMMTIIGSIMKMEIKAKVRIEQCLYSEMVALIDLIT